MSEDEVSTTSRSDRVLVAIVVFLGALAVVMGIGPILMGGPDIRDSTWEVTEVVPADTDWVQAELAQATQPPREIRVGDWVWKVRRSRVVATAVAGEMEGTEEELSAGAIPVALIEIDGWVIAANNGGSVRGQISSSRIRSVSFIDSESRLEAESIRIGESSKKIRADFLTLIDVDGALWVHSKADQEVTIIEQG